VSPPSFVSPIGDNIQGVEITFLAKYRGLNSYVLAFIEHVLST